MRAEQALVAFCLFGAAACADSGVSAGLSVSVTDSAGVRLVLVEGDVADLPTWELGSPLWMVSGDAEPYLGRVGEVEFLSDGRLLVEDNQTDRLHLFAADGSAFLLVGGQGDGPGEFQNLTELTVTTGDSIHAFDRRLYRVSVFSPDGMHVRSSAVRRRLEGVGTTAVDVWALASGRYVLHRNSSYDTTRTDAFPRRDQRDVVLSVTDAQGSELVEPIRFPGEFSAESDGLDAPAPFSPRPLIAVARGRVVHGDARTYDLTLRDPELEPFLRVRWSGWGRPVTEEEVAQVRDTVVRTLDEFRDQRPDLVEQILETQFAASVTPQMRPALGGILLEPGGRMWLSEFAPYTEAWDERDSWHVLAADGTPVARLALPSNARLAAVRHDRVALIVRDELDVEHVHVLPLLSPRPEGLR